MKGKELQNTLAVFGEEYGYTEKNIASIKSFNMGKGVEVTFRFGITPDIVKKVKEKGKKPIPYKEVYEEVSKKVKVPESIKPYEDKSVVSDIADGTLGEDTIIKNIAEQLKELVIEEKIPQKTTQKKKKTTQKVIKEVIDKVATLDADAIVDELITKATKTKKKAIKKDVTKSVIEPVKGAEKIVETSSGPVIYPEKPAGLTI